MGIALAFKRVGVKYRTSLGRLVFGVLIYAGGFIAGMNSHLHISNTALQAKSDWTLGILIASLLVYGAVRLVVDAPLRDR
jgi:hypothetical protein